MLTELAAPRQQLWVPAKGFRSESRLSWWKGKRLSPQSLPEIRWGRRRWIALACVPLVIAVGLACKRYRGPGHIWVNHWGPASVAYEWLWMLLLFAGVPKPSAVMKIAGVVFVGTCLIEVSQLCQAEWLVELRRIRIVQLVLGTTFSWWDFPAYAVGCGLGICLLNLLCRLDVAAKDEPEGGPLQ